MDITKFKEAIVYNRLKYLTVKDTLTKGYISQHAEYKVGDKVTLTTYSGNAGIGFVKEVFLDGGNNIDYRLYACKKDGTPSKNETFPSRINGKFQNG